MASSISGPEALGFVAGVSPAGFRSSAVPRRPATEKQAIAVAAIIVARILAPFVVDKRIASCSTAILLLFSHW
jgi:hypothetical protein